MKFLGISMLVVALSACGGDNGDLGQDGGTSDAGHDSGPPIVLFDASGLTTCATWGSIDWSASDAGVGSGFCMSTGPASDCVATSPDQVVHLCHCTPPAGDSGVGGSNELRCE